MMLTYEEATREIPLPFVRKDKRGRIESYWHAPSTGNWHEDDKLGHEYAFSYMEATHREHLHRLRPPIVCILAAMFEAGVNPQRDRIAHAFLCTIANASYGEWTPAVLAYHRKREAESDAYAEKLLAEQAAERSANARKAALAGAAKRRKAKRQPKRGRA